MMRKLIIFLLCLVSAAPVWSLNKELPRPIASGELSQGLAELKSSVEQMAVSNEALAARNLQLKNRLSVSQAALDKVSREYQDLSTAKMKVEAPHPAKTEQIAHLEKGLRELVEQMTLLQDQVKEAHDSLARGAEEDVQLDEQIGRLENVSELSEEDALSPELAELHQQKQKEKLAMLKRISESQGHQVLLQQQILDTQKSIPDSIEAQNVHRRNMLQSDINRLEAEIEQLRGLLQAQAGQGLEENDLTALETSIADLESNRNQLKDLVAQMKKKTRQVTLTDTALKEQVKLQDHIEDLKNEAKTLRLDLEEAEQEMVELDKRKHQLEILLKGK